MADGPLVDWSEVVNYDRRVVVFYDMLGWRDKILKAGSDPAKISKLRRLILLHVRTIGGTKGSKVNVSTFSDNVVVSTRPENHIHLLLRTLAIFQVSSAIEGFLIRGGITLGDIVHEEEVVFGPGLNRAYEIECKIAKFPRIVIDKEVINKCEPITRFLAIEDGLHFLDPFNVEFIKSAFRDSDKLLADILDELKTQLRAPLEDEKWEKVAWLHDRIASRLDVPLARSYHRLSSAG